MAKAIRIHRAGGPEEMRYEDIVIVAPAEGEVQVRHTAVGLNYIDVYDRTGLYPMPLPGSLGREAAGVVTAVGRKIKDFRPGDRVAYVHTVPGSYCEVRNLPAARLVKLPRSVSDEQAAALMLKGLTAEYLLRRTYRVQRGDWILVHAAVESLDCLAPLGMMVSYGNASGPPPAISPLELSKRGSLFLTRPSLFAYIAQRTDLDAAAKALFAALSSKKFKLHVGQRYALADAARAHRDLEARKTTGSTVLIP
ncbi:MAG: quinone oxidoreductase [Gammaproteobacteria bacterium]|nr:quinone oxidoreductase [Gammaproteobacteria bacterium]